jgi:hypothetical protein
MNAKRKLIVALAAAVVLGVLGGCQAMKDAMPGSGAAAATPGGGHTQMVTLTGANEVPAVDTKATGTATITVKPDRTVTARVTVSGMTPTAAHIHEAAAGANGPVIVPFTKSGDNAFAAPDGAKMTEAQYEAFKAGRTYVNVHSDANKAGEIRAQLKGY